MREHVRAVDANWRQLRIPYFDERSCEGEVIEVSVCGMKRGSFYINIAKKLSLKIALSQRARNVQLLLFIII